MRSLKGRDGFRGKASALGADPIRGNSTARHDGRAISRARTGLTAELPRPERLGFGPAIRTAAARREATNRHGGLDAAAAALGYSTMQVLQNAIAEYCAG